MNEVVYISPKVSYCEKPHEITIVISASITKARFSLLTLWLILFGASGIIISSQMFVTGYDGYTRIGFFAFTCFWVYFMYKIGYAWRWRKSGREFLKITEGKLTIKRAIGAYGKSYEFLIGNIKQIALRDVNEKSFSWELENSFWVLGGERIRFDYMGKEVKFGMQISEADAKKLSHLMIKWFKNSPLAV